MARMTAEPKTELARRLCQARIALGFKERKSFAQYLGLLPETLGNYEIGANEPRASILLLYRIKYGISLEWLLTGEGTMFDSEREKPESTNTKARDKAALQKAVTAVETGLAGLYLPPDKKAEVIDLARSVLKTGKTEPLRRLIHLLITLSSAK